ncbi:TetR family transcriptional regulator [Bibersteinia trehalosi]|uniref:TetR family transcriptional regulator n=1 Tax=Bibersteinia trehalosi TaxID=47735 RepID=A0A3R8SSK5_BIBTR|nr:TetR family transcriptional regulator [Bibersteinia trehalosi]RRN05859.1 TetR family transcriptional regulator [Bibersteinia trehalosi]
MSGQKQDLRVVRTHALIKNALIELLKNNEFEKISVQDIVEKAMINRATFYKYYSGKSDLAGVMIEELKQAHAQLLQTKQQSDDLNHFINTALPAFYEKRQIILVLWKIRTKRHHLWDDMFLMIKNNYIDKQGHLYPKQNLDYQGEILATMMLKTAQYYFEQDLPIPVKQVWREIEQVVKAIQMD